MATKIPGLPVVKMGTWRHLKMDAASWGIDDTTAVLYVKYEGRIWVMGRIPEPAAPRPPVEVKTETSLEPPTPLPETNQASLEPPAPLPETTKVPPEPPAAPSETIPPVALTEEPPRAPKPMTEYLCRKCGTKVTIPSTIASPVLEALGLCERCRRLEGAVDTASQAEPEDTPCA